MKLFNERKECAYLACNYSDDPFKVKHVLWGILALVVNLCHIILELKFSKAGLKSGNWCFLSFANQGEILYKLQLTQPVM